jgi:uncharacterized membrane protein
MATTTNGNKTLVTLLTVAVFVVGIVLGNAYNAASASERYVLKSDYQHDKDAWVRELEKANIKLNDIDKKLAVVVGRDGM